MPIGIIFNSMAIVLGGILGGLMGDRLDEGFKEKLNMIFGLSSMGMGIAAIVLMENMPAVVFSLILGTGLGILIHLEQLISSGAGLMQKGITRLFGAGNSSLSKEEYTASLLTIIVLFCASGTGIYGSIVSGTGAWARSAKKRRTSSGGSDRSVPSYFPPSNSISRSSVSIGAPPARISAVSAGLLPPPRGSTAQQSPLRGRKTEKYGRFFMNWNQVVQEPMEKPPKARWARLARKPASSSVSA